MSGIAGIFRRDGGSIDPAVLDLMGARLAHRGLDGHSRVVRGPAGMFCQLNRISPESEGEIQPLVDSSGLMVVFDGRLDNRAELLAHLKTDRSICDTSSDINLVLAVYRTFGENLPEQLEGDFAFAVFDPARRRLLLARDYLGVRPIYYAQTKDAFIFASEIKALLVYPGIQSRPNDDLFADYLLGQVRDQEITFFRDIFSVAPSQAVFVTPAGLTKHQYWDFDVKAKVRLSSFQEYAEAFSQLFERSVRRRLRSRFPVAVQLSGGLDSSSIFCMSETLRRKNGSAVPPIFAGSMVSEDGTPSDEKAFVSDIERLYGVSVDRFPTQARGFMGVSETATWHVEMPIFDPFSNFMRDMLEGMRKTGSRVVLTGHWADQFLFPQAYLVDLLMQFRWQTLAQHINEFGFWMTEVDPKWFWHDFVMDTARYFTPGAILPVLRKLKHRHHNPWFSEKLHQIAFAREMWKPKLGVHCKSAHARELYEEARTGYHVLCMDWQNKIAAAHGLEPAFPFLDRDLISFLMAIPGDMQSYKGVPKALLRESMRGILPDSIKDRRWKGDYTEIANEAVKTDFEKAAHLILLGKAEAKGYLRSHGLKDRLNELRKKIVNLDGEPAASIGNMTSVEMWLRVFAGETRVPADVLGNEKQASVLAV